jgi:hypothetical protein
MGVSTKRGTAAPVVDKPPPKPSPEAKKLEALLGEMFTLLKQYGGLLVVVENAFNAHGLMIWNARGKRQIKQYGYLFYPLEWRIAEELNDREPVSAHRSTAELALVVHEAIASAIDVDHRLHE